MDSQRDEKLQVQQEHQSGCGTAQGPAVTPKKPGVTPVQKHQHLAVSGADSEEIWEKPNPRLSISHLPASAA